MVDTDEKANHSTTVVVSGSGPVAVVASIQPNPFLSEINISLSLDEAQRVTVTLIDASEICCH